ncbi:MAG: hypothetical protein UX74_C0001G0053 [Parcubacteria group bacterium GW2011_GWA2_47_10b]|uniref:Vitamin K epoxide reductase domain-containing protein n=2 Tax=Parcubacteria group TaxID=1794811 RepID=A0A1G2H1N5_9BACT|nr:MAG: hypothetical protein UX74_C0001G0053 [Parcubacteria group bacterium GW2011_GWA2_47_10b]KKU76535.1 MAG: hypothetical protein UY02_C0018G0016 [Candidatus Giovannonibacteria bacterium GW2011_GWB1_47_6b]OGZ56384.1 MAG: hypothetical protein A3J04_03695 [Candidatus Ryanbacteria bacterium RIFCSPLOWO2_02_FULL_47_14]
MHYKNSTGNKFRKIVIGLLALTGLGLMSYLTVIHYTQASSFCDLSETVSCDVVTTSIYSEIFGIPVSIFGAGYFAFVIFLIFKAKSKVLFQALFYITFFVLFPSLYLTLTEILFIKSLCILCETSKAIMFVILFISLFSLDKKPSARNLAPIAIAGVVTAGVMFFAQTSSLSAKQDYSKLVACLNEKGVIYYKSVTCSNCRRQELILGEPYKKLNQVECHPDGKNPQPELCLKKGINKTPTFILEQNNQELKRLEGRQDPKDLAAFASCSLSE